MRIGWVAFFGSIAGRKIELIDNPLSPPLRSPQQRPQGHPAKSKFLAVKFLAVKLIPALLACLLSVVCSQRSQADEYTDITKKRVENALEKGAKKDAIKLAESSLTALGWFVLYGNDKASADQANKLATLVFNAYNGTEKMDIYMKHTSEAYAEMLNLKRFKGRPASPSDEYAGITKKRVNAAFAKEAGQREFRLAEGSLCALGWYTLYGNGKLSLDLATKLMNVAFAAWPGANEVYMQQSSEAYGEMINLGRFKSNKPIAPVAPAPEPALSKSDGPAMAKTTNSKIVKLHNSSIDVPTDEGFNLNFDPSTGLTWLDASVSRGYSTAEIKKRIADPNDTFYGFRYANQQEIDALLASYGLLKLGKVAGVASASAFIADFGRTGTTQLGPCTTPVWPVSEKLNQYKNVIARTKEKTSSVGQGGILPERKECHFLVGGPSYLATYKNCVVYAASTDYYFAPEGEDKEIQLRDRNSVYQFRIAAEKSPEDVDIKLEDQLIDPSDDLEGIPGANPEMVGNLFLLIYNKDGKSLVVKKVKRN